MVRYAARSHDDHALRARLKVLAEQYPSYGCPLLHAMLRQEGLVLNRKRTYRIYAEERLQVRTKRRKKLTGPRVPMLVPSRPNKRWSVDFVSDQLADGRRFRVLNIVDDFSRECVGQLVDTSISGARMARFLSDSDDRYQRPSSATTFYVTIQVRVTGVGLLSPCAGDVRVKHVPIMAASADSMIVHAHSQHRIGTGRPYRFQHKIQILAEDPNII